MGLVRPEGASEPDELDGDLDHQPVVAAKVDAREVRDPAKPLGIAARRYYRVERRPGPWLEVWMDLREGDDTILPGYGTLYNAIDLPAAPFSAAVPAR